MSKKKITPPTATELRAQLDELKKKLVITEAAEKKAKEEAIRVKRSQMLTLLGLGFIDLITEGTPEKREGFKIKTLDCFKRGHAPKDDATEKQKTKHEADCTLLTEALDLAIAGQLR